MIPDPDDSRQAMLETNVAQADYYNQTDGGLTSGSNGFATNLWRRMRQRALVTVSDTQRDRVYGIHREWLGDLSGKKVLELGVGHGSALSHHLANGCAAYHGLDLSAREIDLLKAHMPKGSHIHYHVDDFLSDSFSETNFDVIYAHSVFHHFEHMDVLFNRIKERLAPGGQIITYDPLQVWLPIRMLRAAYRPFQTDAEWEFPFTRETCNQISNAFHVQDRFGVFNRAKWAMLLGVIHPRLGQRYGDSWFARDVDSRDPSAKMLKSLHISYQLTHPR